jgi:hypothetical protein
MSFRQWEVLAAKLLDLDHARRDPIAANRARE